MATYYPHGSVMPGMNYNSSFGYKYGYQGQFAEKDNESNESFFELRNYEPLLGRFNTIDPYGQHFSSYMAMGNSHPNSVDPDGGWNWVGAAIGAGSGMVAGAAVYGIKVNNGYTFNMGEAAAYVGVGGALGFGIGGGFDEISQVTQQAATKTYEYKWTIMGGITTQLTNDISEKYNGNVGGHGSSGTTTSGTGNFTAVLRNFTDNGKLNTRNNLASRMRNEIRLGNSVQILPNLTLEASGNDWGNGQHSYSFNGPFTNQTISPPSGVATSFRQKVSSRAL